MTAGHDPTGSAAAIEPLDGDRDVSVPVCSAEAYRGATWVPIPGRPHHLRRGGWVYLRHRGALVARVRAVGVAWSAVRPRRTPVGPDDPGFGPGRILVVDPTTFTEVDIDLGMLASRQRSGLRYLVTTADGGVVHLRADQPLPGHAGLPRGGDRNGVTQPV